MQMRKVAAVTVCVTLGLGLFGYGCVPRASVQPASVKGGSGPSTAGAQKPGAPQDSGVDCVHRRVRLRFDRAGAVTKTYDMRIRILTRQGLESWSSVSVVWSPWFEARPEIHAVVTKPNGHRHRLDQSTLSVQPVSPDRADVVSDRRRLHAVLPGLEVGALVDLHVVEREQRPVLAAGGVHAVFFTTVLPTREASIVVEAPGALGLRWSVRGIKLTPRVERRFGGLRRWIFEAGAIAKEPPVEPFTSLEGSPYPHVLVTSARSWRAVAESYHALVAPQASHDGARVEVEKARRQGARERDQIMAALLERVRRTLRYTSLGLGEASIVPVRPDTALARGYGDCKDMANLLVVWLRAAGIPAHLALVLAGNGPDVVSEVPGSGQFNHAVVFVPGSMPRWIDPVASVSTVTSPPWTIQGRWALIIRPGETSLTRIPASRAEENIQTEVRELHLGSEGGARVVETTWATGLLGQSLRALVAGGGPKDFRERMERYARSAYGAETLVSTGHPDPRDLSKPFRLRLEMKNVRLAGTDDDKATCALPTKALWAQVPDILGEPPEEGAAGSTRRSDLLFPTPNVSHLVYRISPPPGYVLKTMPEPGDVRLGPARFSWTCKHDPKSGQVEVRYRLDTGPRRYTAAQVNEYWRDLAQLRKTAPGSDVVFEHQGSVHYREGRYREALEVYRGLRRSYPNDGTYTRQLAHALSEMGYGQAAREVIREAIQRKPGAALLHFLLGMHLERDQFNNVFASGWDLAGSLVAHRKAWALEPKSAHYASAVARMMVMHPDGDQLRAPAALKGPIDEMLRIRRAFKYQGNDPLLAHLLLRARRLDDLEAHLPHLDNLGLRRAYSVVLRALRRGGPAAIRHANELATETDQLADALRSASFLLFENEEYELARHLRRHLSGAAGEENEIARRILDMRSHRPLLQTATKPEDVARRALWLALYTGTSQATFDRVVAAPAMDAATRQSVMVGIRLLGSRLTEMMEKLVLPQSVIADALLSMSETQVAGSDKTGYRIRFQMAGGSAVYLAVYLVPSPTGLRLRATSWHPAELGLEALGRLDAKDAAGARQWLDWARGQDEEHGDSFSASPFRFLWVSGASLPVWQIELAAALLGGEKEAQCADSLRRVERVARRRLSAEQTLQVRRGLFSLYHCAGRLKDAARVSRVLWKASRERRSLMQGHVNALLYAGQVAEAERIASRFLKENPGRREGFEGMGQVLAHQRRFGEAVTQYERAIAAGEPRWGTYNQRAWIALFATPFDAEGALRAARAASQMSSHGNAAALDTLGVVAAEAGHLKEARAALVSWMKVRGTDRPDKHAWYVYGRIAERLGLLDVARDAYRQVPAMRVPDPLDTWNLAQARLKLLGAGAPKMASPPPTSGGPSR